MTTRDNISLVKEKRVADSGALGLPVSIDFVDDGPDRFPMLFCHGRALLSVLRNWRAIDFARRRRTSRYAGLSHTGDDRAQYLEQPDEGAKQALVNLEVIESRRKDAPAVGLRDDRQLVERRHLALAPLGWLLNILIHYHGVLSVLQYNQNPQRTMELFWRTLNFALYGLSMDGNMCGRILDNLMDRQCYFRFSRWGYSVRTACGDTSGP